MISIGILIYGNLTNEEIIRLINSYRLGHNIDFANYEVCIHQTDLESMQKTGDFSRQPIYEYLTRLSPHIYNFYLERTDLKSFQEQRIELLKYLKSKYANLILVFKEDTPIHKSEMNLIDQLNVIKLSV